MTHIEAMKEALEELEHIKSTCLKTMGISLVDEKKLASLRQAIEQAEKPKNVHITWDEYGVRTVNGVPDYVPPKPKPKAEQEPAAREPLTIPEGWKLVPVEPTPEMRKAAADAWLCHGSKMMLNRAFDALKAGIEAAHNIKE